MNPILIYITTKDIHEAKTISEELLKLKLIACSNIIPQIYSCYFWEEAIENSQESVLILKTLNTHFDQIKYEVKKIHSYNTPSIFSVPIGQIDSDYLEWIKKSVKN